MKYRILAVVAALLLLLSFVSCDKGTTEFKLSEFSCTVSFTCAETDFIGELEYISANNISLTMNSPEHIKGIRLVYDGNKTQVSCDGIIVQLENLTVGKDIYAPLFSALTSLSTADIRINKDGTDTVVIGGNADISIKISCNDMRITSVENCGNIYNFQYN